MLCSTLQLLYDTEWKQPRILLSINTINFSGATDRTHFYNLWLLLLSYKVRCFFIQNKACGGWVHRGLRLLLWWLKIEIVNFVLLFIMHFCYFVSVNKEHLGVFFFLPTWKHFEQFVMSGLPLGKFGVCGESRKEIKF